MCKFDICFPYIFRNEQGLSDVGLCSVFKAPFTCSYAGIGCEGIEVMNISQISVVLSHVAIWVHRKYTCSIVLFIVKNLVVKNRENQ
jgi:hypothetical protein